ncbi:MAG TPA: hypothetical protein VIC26_02585 [Marinagarivorans sp.]
MNELIRMQYLDAMGIDSFVPRKILPAAPTSVLCELPVAVECEVLSPDLDVAVNAHAAQPQQASAATEAIMHELLSPADGEPVTVAKSKRAGTAGEMSLQQLLAAKPAPQLRFSLSLWQLNNGVVFVDSRELKGALPTTKLLDNIVKVVFPGEILPRPDVINWPLDASTGVRANGNGLHDAREMTQAFLASRFEQKAPKLLVIMGESAGRVILTPPNALDSQSEKHEAPQWGVATQAEHLGCSIVTLPSLADLLRQPLLKRHIWPALMAR